MASTVNAAFEEFLRDSVRLDPNTTKTARASRDNLIDNIIAFSGDSDFFDVYDSMNLLFGSFARRTKIRPLDDIDLMICLSATSEDQRRSYFEMSGCVYIGLNRYRRGAGKLSQGSRYLPDGRPY